MDFPNSVRSGLIRFSIIIPSLNSRTVGQTIASLLTQAYPPHEVFVVGLDPFDLVHETERVRFDCTEIPFSPGKARNRGAARAEGDILVFIDSDCIARPDWLGILAQRFSDPNITVVGGGVAIHSSNYWTLSDNISMFHDYLSSKSPGTRKQLPSINLAIRRQTFLAIGRFDEDRCTGEDSDLTIRLQKKGYTLFFEPSAVVEHVPTRDSATDLLSHNYRHGQQSVKFDPRYEDHNGLYGLLRTKWGMILASPFLAAGVTARIFLSNLSLLRYSYTAPAIFLAKMAWCFGAATRSYESRSQKE